MYHKTKGKRYNLTDQGVIDRIFKELKVATVWEEKKIGLFLRERKKKALQFNLVNKN